MLIGCIISLFLIGCRHYQAPINVTGSNNKVTINYQINPMVDKEVDIKTDPTIEVPVGL